MIGFFIACIAVVLYVLVKKRLNYFSDRGLNFMKTTWVDQIRCMSLATNFLYSSEVYQKCKNSGKSYMGYFGMGLGPNFVLLDNNLIEKIMIKDFSHFQDHFMSVDVENNPLFGHLFMMKGDEWRTLRNKLLPTFTSGKLKGMTPCMEQCSNDIVDRMKHDVNLRKDANLEFYKDYTLAVIAITAFGLDPESFRGDSEFKNIVKEAVMPNFIQRVKMVFGVSFPKIAKFFKIKLANPEVENYFLKLTKDAFELRKKSGVKRNDFIQLLLELKEKGSVEFDTKDLEEDEKESIKEMQNHSLTKLELTHELLTAQVFIFLFAGFENSAFVAQITTYFLSKHPDIQKRVREEIREVKNKHGKLDYLALRDMKVLSACVDESLRHYTAAPIIMRFCNKSYTLENGEVIEKGTPVMIAADGIHNDSRFWTNPEQFNPDRFLEGKLQPGTYLPFGDGPRICIAQRLAL